MNVYCTLFDSVYLSRGLLLHESLQNKTGDFHLYIFAFDDLCYNILLRLKLPKVTIVPLHDIENDKLLAVKSGRTRAEYCWTCTSSVISYVFEKYNVRECTYVDADLFFYSSPAILIDELKSEKSVLITEHGYSCLSKIIEQKRAGRFCVQFITFKNEPDSLRILYYWRDQCIDWCYARYEDGKFGDQKYLDEWPEKYPSVLILQNPGGGIAPWNLQKYSFRIYGDSVTGKSRISGNEFDVVFFHFHYVRFMKNGFVDLGWNFITDNAKKVFYLPYIERIIRIENYLEKNFPAYQRTVSQNSFSGIRGSIKSIMKDFLKFNLVNVINQQDGVSDKS